MPDAAPPPATPLPEADPGAGLAHDLNQPLTALVLYLQAVRMVVARRGIALPPEVAALLDKAEAEAERARRLVRGLPPGPPGPGHPARKKP